MPHIVIQGQAWLWGPAPSSLLLSVPLLLLGTLREESGVIPWLPWRLVWRHRKGVLLFDWALEWVALSFIRGSSRPRNWIHVSHVSCIHRRVLYQERHLGRPWLRKVTIKYALLEREGEKEKGEGGGGRGRKKKLLINQSPSPKEI